jgi:hypothetical protein
MKKWPCGFTTYTNRDCFPLASACGKTCTFGLIHSQWAVGITSDRFKKFNRHMMFVVRLEYQTAISALADFMDAFRSPPG